MLWDKKAKSAKKENKIIKYTPGLACAWWGCNGIMRGAAGILFIYAWFFTSFSREISLSGYVLDGENNPLAGVTVVLVNENQTVTTDAQGAFVVNGTAIMHTGMHTGIRVPVLISHDKISFTPDRSGTFFVTLYNLKGGVLCSHRKTVFDNTPCLFDIASVHTGSGVFILALRMGNKECFTKYIRGMQGAGRIVWLAGNNGRDGKHSISEMGTPDWNDTLVFERIGYAVQRWPVRKPDDTAVVHLVTEEVHDVEMQMHELVNTHRKSIGLEPLLWNDVAANYARVHSRNISKGITPFGHDGFGDRINCIIQKIKLMTPAENVVASYAVGQSSFNAWMTSSGHKENIEDKYSNITGIGYYAGSGTYYNVYTQIFFIGDI